MEGNRRNFQQNHRENHITHCSHFKIHFVETSSSKYENNIKKHTNKIIKHGKKFTKHSKTARESKVENAGMCEQLI